MGKYLTFIVCTYIHLIDIHVLSTLIKVSYSYKKSFFSDYEVKAAIINIFSWKSATLYS